MSIAQDLFSFSVPLTMLFDAVLAVDTVDTGVGGCWWPISGRAFVMDVNLWNFSKNPHNYSSVADAITFLIMLHSTCTGPFSGSISCISVLGFGPRKKILRLCFLPLVLICMMHLSKCGG